MHHSRHLRSFLRGLLPMVLIGLPLLVLSPSGSASAGAIKPFGHACHSVHGVRFCPTTEAGTGRTANGVKSFDGIPLDADVTLPPTGNGPWPTIVLIHGWGGSKADFEAPTGAGNGNTTYHYNNIYFARHGYAVLNYTARGFGNSCGGGPSADHSGACAKGYIHLDDSRYEARDPEYLLGRLVDERITKPRAIGATGISYGGGLSLELAYLKNRVRLPGGKLVPWTSPRGTHLRIAAAYPRWEWSDLTDALAPNGRYLDFDPATANLSRNPIGVSIQSFVSGLFGLGQASGYYCGNPPASPCHDPSADLPHDFTQTVNGEPYGSSVRAILNDFHRNHQAYGLPLPKGGPAPLLLQNGWTDDLFPPSEALRVYNQLRAISRHARVTLQLGDLGHQRGANKVGVDKAFQAQGVALFNHYLKRSGQPPAPGSVKAYLETCPLTAPIGKAFRAPSWDALHPRATRFGSTAAQMVTAGGDSQDGPPFDPVTGTSDSCKTITPGDRSGTAVYTMKSHGFTMLGLPIVRATIRTTGLYGELDSRLYDVLPDGSERLITRGDYRLKANQTGKITFELHGNGYHFPAGDTVKLELRGNDSPYYRASNDHTFTVKVSKLRVTLPLPAR
ncbi:MAG: CocE/NonD family hydrolase [Solirubrobacteraceae bacterium]